VTKSDVQEMLLGQIQAVLHL